MAKKEVLLADGMTKIAVDDEGNVFGYSAGDVLIADERHAKWRNKEVRVVGFTEGRTHKVIWGQVLGEMTADCAHNPEGLTLVRRAEQSAT